MTALGRSKEREDSLRFGGVLSKKIYRKVKKNRVKYDSLA